MRTDRLPTKGINKDMNIPAIDNLIWTGAVFFTEKRHDELVRCSVCTIKYSPYELKSVSIGKFMCKFCKIEIGGVA